MSDPVTVTLLGEPVAWARSRPGRQASGAGGFAVTPKKQRNTMAALRIAAQQEMLYHGAAVFDEPLRVDMRVEFPIPKSMRKRDQPLALTGHIRPGKKPDIDNLYKLAADALNGVVFRDDALVVDARLSKVYSGQPKIVITIQPFNGISTPIPGLAEMKNDTLENLIDKAGAE